MLYICFELHYFYRFLMTGVLARFFKRNVHILEETKINGICLTNDIDTLLNHMNNTRYLREVDFARIDFHERTGLFKLILKKGGTPAVGCTTIRYRRFIRVFHRYAITSKIIYWDDQGIYMEHRFVTPRDGFVNAVVLSKTRLINCDTEEVMQELIATGADCEKGLNLNKPEMPLELEKWIESNTISSVKIRKEAEAMLC